MRLEMSRRTDLAVRLLRLLAEDGGRRNGPDLAVAIETTPSFLPQVVAPLVRAGWVASTSGPNGGYELVVRAGDLSLLEVIEAFEGPVVDGRCLRRAKTCPGDEPCLLHGPWERARATLLRELRSTPVHAPESDGHAGNDTDPSGNGRLATT